MGKVITFNPDEEKRLLDEWFATTSFDQETPGLPQLAPDPGDDPDETKSIVITPGGRVGSNDKHGSRSNGTNWVERSKPGNEGSLPEYIRIVRNGLMKQGHSESSATGLAVSAIKRWASGRGNVSPKVRAAAAAALAEWEAMKAKA